MVCRHNDTFCNCRFRSSRNWIKFQTVFSFFLIYEIFCHSWMYSSDCFIQVDRLNNSDVLILISMYIGGDSTNNSSFFFWELKLQSPLTASILFCHVFPCFDFEKEVLVVNWTVRFALSNKIKVKNEMWKKALKGLRNKLCYKNMIKGKEIKVLQKDGKLNKKF